MPALGWLLNLDFAGGSGPATDQNTGWHDLGATQSWTHGDSDAFPSVQIRRNVDRPQTIQANNDQ